MRIKIQNENNKSIGVKECTQCKKIKNLSEFSKKQVSKDKYSNICKVCSKSYQVKYKKQIKVKVSFFTCILCNKTKDINMFNKSALSHTGFKKNCRECENTRNKNYKLARLQWYYSIKADIPCFDCDKIYESCCMDYDHVRGVKINNVSSLVNQGAIKQKILNEIKKCELVCVICHNKRTHSRKSKRNFIPTAERNLKIINEAKNKPCYKCGQIRESYNMQFDHTNPMEKYRDISKLTGSKVEIILNEITKCKVICALCHRIKSISDIKSGKYPKAKERKRIVRRKLFIDIDNQKKECFSCNNILNFDKFGKNRNTSSILQSSCKKCFNAYRRELRSKNSNTKKNFFDTDNQNEELN